MVCSRCQINAQKNSVVPCQAPSRTDHNCSKQNILEWKGLHLWSIRLLKINQARHSSHKFKTNNTQKFYHHSHNSIRDYNTSVIFGTKLQLLCESQSSDFTVLLESYSLPLRSSREDLIILHLVESLDIIRPIDFIAGCWCSDSVLSAL